MNVEENSLGPNQTIHSGMLVMNNPGASVKS
jgi:hypothetical protein